MSTIIDDLNLLQRYAENNLVASAETILAATNRKPSEIEYLGVIIGGESPSRYSLSPHLWNKYFEASKEPGIFLPIDAPDTETVHILIAHLLSMPRTTDITITNPFKSVLTDTRYSNPLNVTFSDSVLNIGALNHIIIANDNAPLAINTDGTALVESVISAVSTVPEKAVLFGAGGAGRSIAWALAATGILLTIVDPYPDSARSLADALNNAAGKIVHQHTQNLSAKKSAALDLVISAIPADCPMNPADLGAIRKNRLIVDIRYGDKALFSNKCKKLGHTCIDGREMVFNQFSQAADCIKKRFAISQDQHRDVIRKLKKKFMQEAP